MREFIYERTSHRPRTLLFWPQINSPNIILVLTLHSCFSGVLPNLSQTSRTQIISSEQSLWKHPGENATFSCQVRNLGTAVLIWKHGSRVLSAGDIIIKQDPRISLQNSGLHLANLRAEDEGIYKCEVEIEIDSFLSLAHQLHILKSPSIRVSTPSREVKVLQGSSIRVQCSASGVPKPQVHWIDNNGEVVQGNNSAILKIHHSSRLDSGEYRCIADNGVGTPVTQSINIIVNYAPDAKARKLIVYTGPGLQAELTCTVHASPPASVSWYKETFLIQDDSRTEVIRTGDNFILIIKNVKASDLGNYTCSASSSLGKGSADVHLSGLPETPIVNPGPYSSTSYVITWSCGSYSKITQYKINYRKMQIKDGVAGPGVSISVVQPENKDSSHIYKYTYLIENLWPDTWYEFTVEAENMFGWSIKSKIFKFQTERTESADQKAKMLAYIPTNSKDPHSELIISSTTTIIYNNILLSIISCVLIYSF